MAQITPDKPPENIKPCRTAVEVSNDRRFGIGGSKATLYNCNFARNDEEWSGKKKKKQNKKRSWAEWWMESEFYMISAAGVCLIFAGLFSGSTGSTLFLIAGAVMVSPTLLAIFMIRKKIHKNDKK